MNISWKTEDFYNASYRHKSRQCQLRLWEFTVSFPALQTELISCFVWYHLVSALYCTAWSVHTVHCTLYSIHSIAVQSWKHHPSSLEMQNSTNEQIICNQQNRCNTSAFYWNGKHSDGRLFEWNIYDDLIMEMLFITLNAGAHCWCCEGWRRLNSIDWLWLPLRTERYITPMNINK